MGMVVTITILQLLQLLQYEDNNTIIIYFIVL